MGFGMFVGMAHFNISQYLTPVATTRRKSKTNDGIQVNVPSWVGYINTQSGKVKCENYIISNLVKIHFQVSFPPLLFTDSSDDIVTL